MTGFRFRRTTIALAALALASACAVSQATPARGYVGEPVFFFTPHQDDEVLFMGAAIREHVVAGRKVWVVLLTDGGSSAYCLPTFGTREACVAARDKEFVDGVTSMGATPIIRADRMVDGTLTVAYAKKVVLNYYANVNYKRAAYKTMSEFDGSPDHANLGKGLRAAVGPTDKRFYIKHSEWGSKAGTFTAKYNLNATLDMYPFGHISVPGDFAYATYPTGAFSKVYA